MSNDQSVLTVLVSVLILVIVILILVPILTLLIHLGHETRLADKCTFEERDGFWRIVIEAHPLQAFHGLVTVDGEYEFVFGLARLG